MPPPPDIKVPGDRVGVVAELVAGPGTFVRGPFVYASTTGAVTVAPGDPLPTVSVQRAGQQAAIPSVGVTVIAKVSRVTPRAAMADIVCVGAHAVTDKFSGIV
ncbi:hypothetical protein CLOM_g1963, partial [Closterium sp. NIES-68]